MKTTNSDQNIGSARRKILSDRNYIEYMADKLNRDCATDPGNKEHVFEAHRRLFDELIEKFSQHARAMQLVKNGFEGLLEEFRQSSEDSLQRRSEEEKGMETIQAEIENQRGKLVKKREEIGSLIQNVKTLIFELTDEIASLKNQVVQEKQNLAAQFESLTRMQMTTMQHQETLEKLEQRKAAKEEKLRELKSESERITSDHEREKKEMLDNLDLTYDLSYQIKKKQTELQKLLDLEKDPVHIQQVELKQECETLASQIRELQHETETLDTESDALERAIEIVKNRPEESKFIYGTEHAPLSVSESVHFAHIRA